MSLRPLLILGVLFTAVALSGCKGNCQQLSEKLCDCAQSSGEKQSCLTRVSSAQGTIGTSATDEALCGRLMNRCDCHIINTPAGKQACGLAR